MNQQKIDLKEIEKDFIGKKFGELILFHIERQRKSIFTPRSKLINFFLNSFNGTYQNIPSEARPLIEGFIDSWNPIEKTSYFWKLDCSIVFSQVINSAKKILTEKNIPFNDEILFNFFQIRVLNYAYNAVCEKNMERFIKDSCK